MSAQDAMGRQFFTPIGNDEYAIEARKGKSYAATHGRVSKFGHTWAALGVGSPRWTDYHRTRKAAVDQMFQMRSSDG